MDGEEVDLLLDLLSAVGDEGLWSFVSAVGVFLTVCGAGLGTRGDGDDSLYVLSDFFSFTSTDFRLSLRAFKSTLSLAISSSKSYTVPTSLL